MINQTLLWLLAIPVCLGIALFALRHACKDAWIPCVGFTLVAMIIIAGAFYISKGAKISDIEIWNGQVISKERQHGTYEQPYQCFCTTDANGNTSCQTCYETHYTVEWVCNTSVGQYQIEKLDSTFRSVYDSPDPLRYTTIKDGDPVAKRMSYVNYIQAVPNSLFDPAAADVKEKFKDLLSDYPDNVYDFYKLNRFVVVGLPPPTDAKQWNEEISLGLRELGPKKQVNLIIVVAKTADSSYEYALRDHWDGVNKNDVVLLIGSTEYPKIDFVRVISWTKNELFKVELRDVIQEKGMIDRSIIQTAFHQISHNFERREMREFSYLDGEIDPPDWLVYVIIFVVVGGAVAVYLLIPNWCAGGLRRRFRY